MCHVPIFQKGHLFSLSSLLFYTYLQHHHRLYLLPMPHKEARKRCHVVLFVILYPFFASSSSCFSLFGNSFSRSRRSCSAIETPALNCSVNTVCRPSRLSIVVVTFVFLIYATFICCKTSLAVRNSARRFFTSSISSCCFFFSLIRLSASFARSIATSLMSC